MPDKHYEFSVKGMAANDTEFDVTGRVYCDFAQLFNVIMTRTFEDLTMGTAVFGKPGQGGCVGPYEVNEITVKRVETRR